MYVGTCVESDRFGSESPACIPRRAWLVSWSCLEHPPRVRVEIKVSWWHFATRNWMEHDGTWWNYDTKGLKSFEIHWHSQFLTFTGFHITFWGSKKPLNPAVAFKVLQHKSFFGGIQGLAFLNLSGDERMRRQHTAVPKHKQTDNLTGFWGPMGTHKTSSNGHGLRACTPGGHQNIAGKWMLISPKKWFFIFFLSTALPGQWFALQAGKIWYLYKCI